MALMNYSLPYGPHVSNTWSTIATGLQAPHANAVNGLLYDPAAHQEEAAAPYGPDYYRNNPYGPPRHMQSNFRNTNYLPPHPVAPNPAPHTHTPTQPRRGDYGSYTNSQSHVPTTRTYGESSYSSRGSVKTVTSTTTTTTTASGAGAGGQFGFSDYSRNSQPSSFNTRPVPRPTVSRGQTLSGRREQVRPPSKQGEPPKSQSEQEKQGGAGIPGRPGGYVHVQSGQGKNTHTVAVVDYDDDEEDGEEDDEYYDTADGAQPDGPNSRIPNVTPIQGPIFLGQNGTVPVVPLVQNPTLTNSSFVQIPIWWTALSVALGLNVRGDVIRGAPCIKRNHQLFCPQAGSQYPKDKIEAFIDDNKALMKRMYGDFSMSEDYGSVLAQSKKRKRNAKWDDPYEPDWAAEMYGPPGAGPDPIRDAGPSGDSYFSRLRNKRQSSSSRGNNSRRGNRADSTGRVDACESKVEIVTPYWASNSAGKIRAIVNTQHFEQAIHQEVCTNVQTSRCAGDCGCEQKYKWHRLLAYDPDNDCKGIFMDWFLFPSCCVCRCNPLTTN